MGGGGLKEQKKVCAVQAPAMKGKDMITHYIVAWPHEKGCKNTRAPGYMSTLFIHCYQRRLVMKATEKVKARCCCSLCWVTAPWLHNLLFSTDRGRRKQPTIHDSTIGFPTKWCLRNDNRNSTLTMHQHPDPGSASDWLKNCFIESEALSRSG